MHAHTHTHTHTQNCDMPAVNISANFSLSESVILEKKHCPAQIQHREALPNTKNHCPTEIGTAQHKEALPNTTQGVPNTKNAQHKEALPNTHKVPNTKRHCPTQNLRSRTPRHLHNGHVIRFCVKVKCKRKKARGEKN